MFARTRAPSGRDVAGEERDEQMEPLDLSAAPFYTTGFAQFALGANRPQPISLVWARQAPGPPPGMTAQAPEEPQQDAAAP